MSETLLIVLPCHATDQNALERSLLSLVTQAGDFRLHIHVQNAGPQARELAPFLARWQARMGTPQIGLHCRDVWFSYQTMPEAGFYAALRAGLDHLSENPDRFLSWLRPGDILLPGALAHLADLARNFSAQELRWVQGAAGHLIGERLSAAVQIKTPTALLAQGLSDTLHWPAPAQGGMVFRAGLWLEAQGHAVLADETLIAEWQLWQRFAKIAPLVQSPQPLGIFAHVLHALPAHKQVALRRRIAQSVPTQDRLAAWKATLARGPLLRHVIQDTRPEGPVRIVAQDVTPQAHAWAEPRGLWPAGLAKPPRQPPQTLATGQAAPASGLPSAPQATDLPFADLQPYRMLRRDLAAEAAQKAVSWRKLGPLADWVTPAQRRNPMWQATRLWAWDQDWHPSKHTEWAVLRAVQHLGEIPRGTGYAAFPWATLIDALATDTPERTRLERDFTTFCTVLPYASRRITTCQHADLMAHLDLFKRARITDVFWPHATASQVQLALLDGIVLHSIAHCPGAPMQRGDPLAKRPQLLGAQAVKGADLRTCRFAMCPPGRGGHSARLWQVIAAGAIPVIRTATPGQAMPGPTSLWLEAAIFIEPTENAMADLPGRLAAIAANKTQMAAHHQALAQLWLAYGPEGVANGIHALMARHTDQRQRQQGLAAPEQITRKIKIYHLGPRAARSPLGYAPLARLAEPHVTRVDSPAEADLALTGWNRDLAENPDLLADAYARNPGLRCMVISEEPLWDTVWSDGFEARDRPFECGGQLRSYRFVNHMNARIFEFEHMPYFLLTSADFIPRYVAMLGRYAQMRPRSLLGIWNSTVMAAAFVSEHREGPEFDMHAPRLEIEGLSGYRTRVAEAASHPKIWRIGQGWPGTQTRRQDLPDWHLDKLAYLQGQVRMCGAYENTHVNSYISEKPFDAFAIGAMPICYVGPDHRLNDLIEPYAMLNTYGQPAETAAAWVDWFVPEIANAEAWLESAASLRARLAQADAVAAERARVVTETLREIEQCLQSAP